MTHAEGNGLKLIWKLRKMAISWKRAGRSSFALSKILVYVTISPGLIG